MTKFDKIKKSKLFAPADIIVYILLAALVVALFGAFVWQETPALTSISATISEKGAAEEIFSYDFDKDKLTVAESWKNRIVITEEGDNIAVVFLFDGGEGENVLVINRKERWAQMTEADCSFHHDCTTFPPIDRGGAVIICLPRGFTVRGEGPVEDIQPGVG